LCLAGLLIGLAAFAALRPHVGPLMGTVLGCAGAYLGGCLCGVVCGAVSLMRRKPLDLLQVKGNRQTDGHTFQGMRLSMSAPFGA